MSEMDDNLKLTLGFNNFIWYLSKFELLQGIVKGNLRLDIFVQIIEDNDRDGNGFTSFNRVREICGDKERLENLKFSGGLCHTETGDWIDCEPSNNPWGDCVWDFFVNGCGPFEAIWLKNKMLKFDLYSKRLCTQKSN